MDTITENVRVYLERFWGYKDKRLLIHNDPADASLLEQLKTLAPKYPELYHLQIEDKHTWVWMKKDWDMDYQNHIQKKELSEKRIKEHDEQKENIAYISELIIAHFGPEIGPGISDTLAKKIVMEKNKPGALMFNADLTKMKGW